MCADVGWYGQALEAREEDAKRAKVDAIARKRREAEEGDIKEAGRVMLEKAQKAAATAAAAASKPIPTPKPSSTSTIQPIINPEDLTLTLLIPTSSPLASTSTLQSSIKAKYGGINHLILKDQASGEEGAKKKIKKSVKGIVEFEKGNWGGCWACWDDHVEGRNRGLGEGVKVKWAKGETPEWVAWAEEQLKGSNSNGQSGNDQQQRQRRSSPEFAFGSAPDIGGGGGGGGTTMEELLARNGKSREEEKRSTSEREEFESLTLLKMRKMERERMEEEIRRQDEQEEAGSRI
jgi:DnaJ family protein C protein 17